MNEKIEKNKEYILQIDGMGYQGEGVGKINGFTIFVPGAIKGEKIKIKAVKVNKNFAFGKLLEVIESSPHRVSPPCSIYKRCGGCQLQHMSYRAQLDFKKNRVKDCLERIGKFNIVETAVDLCHNQGKSCNSEEKSIYGEDNLWDSEENLSDIQGKSWGIEEKLSHREDNLWGGKEENCGGEYNLQHNEMKQHSSEENLSDIQGKFWNSEEELSHRENNLWGGKEENCGGEYNLQHNEIKLCGIEEKLGNSKGRFDSSGKKCITAPPTLPEGALRLYDTIGMKNPYRYRNKVQLPVNRSNFKLNIGFYAKRSHDIIDMDSCLIQDESADEVVKLIRKWIEKYNIPVYDEKTGQGIIRHIMVRKAFATGEIMVVIVTSTLNLPGRHEIIEVLTENMSGIKSIVQNINSMKTNVILGQKCITLWGQDTISDYIGKFKFNISPLSFFQVNPVQTEILYSKALEYAGLTGNEIVFDAYCGTGTISLFLSQKAKKVYGVEIIEEAVKNARINAVENGVNNVEFIAGKSEMVIPQLIKQGIKADVVVVDPPRKGCDKSLLQSIGSMAPKTIVYVSCDPATLARDLGVLRDMRYMVEKVQPVDMFAQTAHVETVVLITRIDK
ncbi:23S rRNA (uracil(1939)-C(5))-methyltransferase RlmD [Clostridium sp. JNZ X4-2]